MSNYWGLGWFEKLVVFWVGRVEPVDVAGLRVYALLAIYPHCCGKTG